VDNFKELKRFATWPMVFFLLFVELLYAILVTIIEFEAVHGEGSLGAAIGVLFAFSIVFFFLRNGLFHGLANCMAVGAHERAHTGPQPCFLQLCFLTLLYGLPLDVVSILTIIPFIGWVISVALFIYSILLLVYSLQAIYHISSGQAIGIIVVFAVLFVVLVIVLYVTAAALFVSLIFRSAA